jgi:hypothetical protein
MVGFFPVSYYNNNHLVIGISQKFINHWCFDITSTASVEKEIIEVKE